MLRSTTEIERSLFAIEDKYEKMAALDRSVDHQRVHLLRTEGLAQCAAFKKPITEALSHSTGYITCAAVAVDPLFQGYGIGSRMMRWGMERAEKEGIPILLIASQSGYSVYEKLGFETLGRPTIEAMSSDAVMAYWPKGVTRVEATITEAVERDEVRQEEAQVVDRGEDSAV